MTNWPSQQDGKQYHRLFTEAWSESNSEEWAHDYWHNWEALEELHMRNALALGIPRAVIQGQPTGIILSLIEAFQKRDNGERKERISTPPAPFPRKGDNTFLSLREELQDMK